MFATLRDALLLMWPWEAIAVAALIAYLLLAIRQSILCWPAAIVGTGIYIVLTFRVGLYMEAALQLFYLAMAVYGWYHWLVGADRGGALPVVSWPLAFNLLPCLLIGISALSTGYLLANYSTASWPYINSFTAWGAIWATWMVARKVLQNWHYWFVIDAVSAFMYGSKGMLLTALLYIFYLVLIYFGWRAWSATRAT